LGGFQTDGAISFAVGSGTYDLTSDGAATIDITSDFSPQSLASYEANELRDAYIIQTSTVTVAGISCAQIFYADVFSRDAVSNATGTTAYHNVAVYCPSGYLYKFYLSRRGGDNEAESLGVFHHFLSTFKFIPGIVYAKPRSGLIKSFYQKGGAWFADVQYVQFLAGSDAERALQQGPGCLGLNNNATSAIPCFSPKGYIGQNLQSATTTLSVSDAIQIFDTGNHFIDDHAISLSILLGQLKSANPYWWIWEDNAGVITKIAQQYTP
jgi:hypothetical protein